MNWINVKDRMPEPGVRVLATDGVAVKVLSKPDQKEDR